MGEIGVTVDMVLDRKEWRRRTRPTPYREVGACPHSEACPHTLLFAHRVISG